MRRQRINESERSNDHFVGGAEEDRQVEKGRNYTGSYLQYEHDASSIAAVPPTRGRLVVVIGPRPSDRRDDGINIDQFIDLRKRLADA